MGKIEIIEHKIEQLGRKRKLRIYLPDAYEQATTARFGVLYMHDACNLYDDRDATYGTAWKVSEALERLVGEGRIEPIIIVGIDNGEYRWEEYSPWLFSGEAGFKGYDVVGRGGEGAAYGTYIVESLKPMIDACYRTKTEKQYTGIAGSSMGGFISMYVGMKYSDIFGYIGAFSTATWFAEKELLDFMEQVKVNKQYYYLDTGTHECITEESNPYYTGLVKMYDTLLNKGIQKENLHTVVDVGAEHCERDWARRFPDFLVWVNKKL